MKLDKHFFKNFLQVFNNKDDELVVVDADDLLSRELQPKEFILYPWLATQDIAAIHGPKGIGKSYLAMSLAVAVASGWKFLHWEINKPRGVLYVDGIMPEKVIQGRLRDIMSEKILQAPLRIVSRAIQGISLPDLSTIRGQELLEPHLKDISLIIFDSLLTLCPAINEYDQESWKPFERWLLDLKHRGHSILFLHNTSNHGRMRGSSRMEDILDTIIQLKPLTSDRARFLITFDKSVHCYGDAIKSFGIKLATDSHGKQEWTYSSKEKGKKDSCEKDETPYFRDE